MKRTSNATALAVVEDAVRASRVQCGGNGGGIGTGGNKCSANVFKYVSRARENAK